VEAQGRSRIKAQIELVLPRNSNGPSIRAHPGASRPMSFRRVCGVRRDAVAITPSRTSFLVGRGALWGYIAEHGGAVPPDHGAPMGS